MQLEECIDVDCFNISSSSANDKTKLLVNYHSSAFPLCLIAFMISFSLLFVDKQKKNTGYFEDEMENDLNYSYHKLADEEKEGINYENKWN